MTLSFVFFGISVAGIIALIGMKWYELRSGTTLFLSRWSTSSDIRIVKMFAGFARGKRQMFFFWVRMMYVVRVLLQRAALAVVAAIQRLLAKIAAFLRGKTFLKKKGSVSFFLKDVAHYKNQTRDESVMEKM